MNDSPIQEQKSFMDRVRNRGVESYRFTALKVGGIGMLTMFIGELLEWSELTTIGIWVMLAAFPVHGLYLVAHYAQVIKEANQEVDESVKNAAEARKARGDE
jgi:hypothetical protein